jgi:hypothetical protein
MSDIMSITYEDAIPVSQSDTVKDPNGPFAGFYVGGSGNVTVTTGRGRTALFNNCQPGTIYPVVIKNVWVDGTTATGILGMVAVPYPGQGQ